MGSKRHEERITRAIEGLLQLPRLVVIAGLWLWGVALISLFGLALYILIYVLIYLLGIVSGP